MSVIAIIYFTVKNAPTQQKLTPAEIAKYSAKLNGKFAITISFVCNTAAL